MNLRHLSLSLAVIALINCQCFAQTLVPEKKEPSKIQIALLLDISGSMDQLIVQAKSQFWKIANYINRGTKNGKKSIVEFALITYGGASGTQDAYTTIMSPLTPNLDSLADQLHQIIMGGSEEHCWTAINIAIDHLTWSE